MKKTFIIISIVGIVIGSGGFVFSYYILNTTTIGLIQHLSSGFIGISLGIIIVNMYLVSKSKQGAVYSILNFSDTSLSLFHNRLLDFMWTKFGANEWLKLVQEYIDGDQAPEVIPPEKREIIYEIIKKNINELNSNIRTLESTLVEMSYLIGWDLDADLLESIMNARNSIGKFFQVKIDDSPKSKLAAVKHLIDIDFSTTLIRTKLMELSDTKEVE